MVKRWLKVCDAAYSIIVMSTMQHILELFCVSEAYISEKTSVRSHTGSIITRHTQLYYKVMIAIH
jgi:hypothetical protein